MTTMTAVMMVVMMMMMTKMTIAMQKRPMFLGFFFDTRTVVEFLWLM